MKYFEWKFKIVNTLDFRDQTRLQRKLTFISKFTPFVSSHALTHEIDLH